MQKWKLLVLLGMAFALIACGGAGSDSDSNDSSDNASTGETDTTTATLNVDGRLKSSSTERITSNSTPHKYKVAVSKVELLQSEDDENPVTVLDASVRRADFAVRELTNDRTRIARASTLGVGTYTHLRMTIVMVAQQIDYLTVNDNARRGSFIQIFEDYDNSDGDVGFLPSASLLQGDVLGHTFSEDFSSNFTWMHLTQNQAIEHVETRDDAVLNITPGSNIRTIALDTPVTLNEGDEKTVVVDFDVTNTFSWEDLDEDSLFEPVTDDFDTDLNRPDFTVQMPTLDVIEVE